MVIKVHRIIFHALKVAVWRDKVATSWRHPQSYRGRCFHPIGHGCQERHKEHQQ
jgi:hypothetical protein